MSKEERIAIQNVVGGRQPKLIQLQPEESEEDMRELDKKLAEAFKAIGGRKDRLTKKKE